MQVGDRDGHGRFGVLTAGPDGRLVCHECGLAHRHLGLHVWKAHGVTAAQYRTRHGLARGRGLVADDLAQVIRANAQARMGRPAGAGFVAARDPGRASAARLEERRPWAPQVAAAHARRMAERGKAPRRVVVVVVVCEWCGSQFCPIGGHPGRRRFCCRSCANTANRRTRDIRGGG